MRADDFERMYEKARPQAVRVARAICGDDAEDAVQNTAIYFLERLSSNPYITPSLFIERVRQRAHHLVEDAEPSPRKRRVRLVHPVGHTDELALLEKEQMPEHGRRVPPAPRAE